MMKAFHNILHAWIDVTCFQLHFNLNLGLNNTVEHLILVFQNSRWVKIFPYHHCILFYHSCFLGASLRKRAQITLWSLHSSPECTAYSPISTSRPPSTQYVKSWAHECIFRLFITKIRYAQRTALPTLELPIKFSSAQYQLTKNKLRIRSNSHDFTESVHRALLLRQKKETQKSVFLT